MDHLFKLSPLKTWWLLAMIPPAVGLVFLALILVTPQAKDKLAPAYFDAVKMKLNRL